MRSKLTLIQTWHISNQILFQYALVVKSSGNDVFYAIQNQFHIERELSIAFTRLGRD